MNTETNLGPNSKTGIADEESLFLSESFGDGTVIHFSNEDPETGEPIEGTIYYYGSLHGRDVVNSTVNNRFVQSEMVMLGSLGYSLVRENSKLVESEVAIPVDSGIAMQNNVILTFSDPGDTTRYAYISYVSLGEYRTFVQSGEIKFHSAPEDTLFHYIGSDGLDIWLKDYPARLVTMENDIYLSSFAFGAPSVDPDWNLKEWVRCTVETTAGCCTAAAVVCLFAGPAWAPCTGAACLGCAAGAAVACATDQFFDWLGW